jgi:predicted RNase H-like HicB family nuclease
MSAFPYPAKFTAGSDGRVLVEFVDLPRVSTDGKDDHEAMEEAMDALASELSIRLSRREAIPAASAAKRGQRLVPVPLWLAPKLALYLAMRDQEINNSEAGAPPWGPRASDSAYARSGACYEGGKNTGGAGGFGEADDRGGQGRGVGGGARTGGEE